MNKNDLNRLNYLLCKPANALTSEEFRTVVDFYISQNDLPHVKRLLGSIKTKFDESRIGTKTGRL